MTRSRSVRTLALGLALACLVPGSREALAQPQPQPPSLDALAIVTDTAIARIAQSLLPLRFVVDGTGVTLGAVTLCPAADEHDVDFVGLAGPDGAEPIALPQSACQATLPALAATALTQETASPWRAAVRVRLGWNEDSLRANVTDSAIAGRATPAAASVPGGARVKAVLTAAPLFDLDTRRLVQLEFSGHRFDLAIVPKFETHRTVVELMRDEREADDHAGWAALEDDASAAVPAGSDAVVAATHPFVGRTLGEAFATPVEIYRAQDHVITLHDVREAGANGDVRASGEAVDTVSGASGTIAGEYESTPSGDLTLRRVDVLAHERQCGFVDLACVANNVGLRVGSGALARQIMSRYGNSPLRPAQPLSFPIALPGRNLTLGVDAIQTRSTTATLRVAGRLGVSAR